MRNTKPTPMTCIDGACDRCGVQVFNGDKCKSCDGDLFPYHDFEFTDVNPEGEAGEFSGKENPAEFHQYSWTPKSTPEKQGSDVFRCAADLTSCPIAPRRRAIIPVELYQKWVYLARQFKTEWIAYLTGTVAEGDNGDVTIDGMYFPEQKVNGIHCEPLENQVRPGTVATVHSHVGMAARFSTEDWNHFNHPIEIVVNNSGDISVNGRIKLGCGSFHRGDAQIVWAGSQEQDGLAQELKEKLSHDGGSWSSKGRRQTDLEEAFHQLDIQTLG